MRSQTLSSKDDAGDDYHDHNDSILLFEFPHFIRQFFPVISRGGGGLLLLFSRQCHSSSEGSGG